MAIVDDYEGIRRQIAIKAAEKTLSQMSLGIRPEKRKYFADLLAQCDFSLPWTAEEREWVDSAPVGREII